MGSAFTEMLDVRTAGKLAPDCEKVGPVEGAAAGVCWFEADCAVEED